MEVWERKAIVHINIVRTEVALEEERLQREVKEGDGLNSRLEELEAIQIILNEIAAHIDPHGVIPWEHQSRLPF